MAVSKITPLLRSKINKTSRKAWLPTRLFLCLRAEIAGFLCFYLLPFHHPCLLGRPSFVRSSALRLTSAISFDILHVSFCLDLIFIIVLEDSDFLLQLSYRHHETMQAFYLSHAPTKALCDFLLRRTCRWQCRYSGFLLKYTTKYQPYIKHDVPKCLNYQKYNF